MMLDNKIRKQVSNPCIKYYRRACGDKNSTTKCEKYVQTRAKLYGPPHFAELY